MKPTPPNIILLILDTTRRDRLSLYGADRPTSPHLSEFAEKGAVYHRAVAPAQWTIPSHTSLFTGTMPSVHGVTQSNSRIASEQKVLAEYLQEAGYHTVAFCNNPLVGVLNNGLQRGFEHFYNYASAVPHRPNDHKKFWLRREFSRRFRPFARKVGNQFALSDTMFRVALNPLFTPVWTRFINFKGNTAHSISDTIDYWQAHVQGGNAQPIFAFINLMEAHLPYWPSNDALDKVAPTLRADRAEWQRRRQFVQQFNADGAAWASPPEPPLSDWQQEALLDFYDAELAQQDAHIGRLFSYLEQSGQMENTVVMIAADHGEGHGDHQLFGHGFNVHQELVHVPLVIRGERFEQRDITQVTSTRHLFETVLDLASVEMSDLLQSQIDLHSLASSATSQSTPTQTHIGYSEAYAVNTFLNVLEHNNPSVIERMLLRETYRCLYEDDLKLILRQDEPIALYNIQADPQETRNLLYNQPDQVQAMVSKVQALNAHQTHKYQTENYNEEDEAQVAEHLRALGYIE